jgi:RNA polymerase sigma factor (sigma-70 family)
MQPTDDSALLRQYADNNSDEAFAALVTRHINLVYSVALRQAGNPHAAEEITQAVFIILAKKAAQLRHDEALSSWLFQATRLTANNFVRSEARRHRREEEAYMQSVLDEAGTEVWPRIAPLLDDAVAGLREKDRRALVLRFYEGRNLREVGLALGASEDAAEKRVNRALEKLRKFFTQRGVSSTTAIIAGTISANSVQAAPVALAKSVTAVALAKGAAASGSTLTLIKGALKIMAWTKMKTAVVAGAVLILAAGTTTVVIKHYSHHSPGKLPLTPANMASFERESTKLVRDAKMATLSCMMFAADHQNQLPKNFTQLNAAKVQNFITRSNSETLQTKLSDADWEFTTSGDKDSFTNPDTTIYFLEKEPRQSPDGTFVKVYATVNGRVFLVTSPGIDFTTAEKERGFLVQRTKN